MARGTEEPPATVVYRLQRRPKKPARENLLPQPLDVRQALQRLSEYPRAYLLDPSFPSVTAFIEGCHVGTEGALLDGFSEWLTLRIGTRSNLAWPGQVLLLAFEPDAKAVVSRALTKEQDEHARQALFNLLFDFLAEHDGLGGIAGIRARYDELIQAEDQLLDQYLAEHGADDDAGAEDFRTKFEEWKAARS